MAKTPISEFYNLMALSNMILSVSFDGGPPIVVRPGSDKDRSTPAETLLWRYMPKDFVFDLIESRSLFFTRLTYHHIADPFEGALPYAVSALHELIVQEKGGDVAEFLKTREEFVKKFLRIVLVNSWHERPYESHSMWDRYGKGQDAAAVVTTFQRLRESLPARADIGHIDYIDVGRDEIVSHFSNPSHRAFQKAREFEDEMEVRAMIFDWPDPGPKLGEEIPIDPGTEIGYRVPVEINRLFQRVVVSPQSPHIIDELRSRVRASGLDIEVTPSTLSRRPTY